MTRMTDEELRQEIEALVKRRVEEQSLLTPYEDPREFGRRIARETFEKRVEASNERTSGSDDT